MPDTNHLLATLANAATYIVNSTPFFPSFTEEEGGKIKIKFNAAYIFDYGNGGERIAVGGLEHTLGEDESKKFKLEILIDHESGLIEGAEIKKDGESNIDNLIVRNDYEDDDDGNIVADAKYVLDLADINGKDIEELYIRENIHWHYRYISQAFDPSGGPFGGADPQSEAPILNTSETHQRAGELKVRCLVAPGEDNELSITYDEDNIYLVVISSDEGGDDDGGE
ncbi:hypothetical protein N9973_00605 [bacterium]|nr:hypothetical protein [bacterium]